MKLHWGNGIFGFYILFVLFIGFMIYLTTTQNYDLVTENYYEEEIKYQNKIDQKERTKALDKSLFVSIDNGKLKINFPNKEKEIKGKVLCFRPSDDTKDFTEEINSTEGVHTIPLDKFIKGKYIFKVSWEVEGESYYNEQTVIIP